MSPDRAMLVRSAVLGGAVLAVAGFLRRRSLRWGATDHEASLPLPGDELMASANLTATRAVTIGATAEEIWPWIAQLGQGRGGFYSYDLLENLVGCDIHSADRIVQEWQGVEVGATVNLAAQVPLTVALVDSGKALVLSGGIPLVGDTAPYSFTWAFVLREDTNGTTRLVVRERYGYLRRWAPLLVEPVELVSLVMSRRMLRGIRERSEHGTSDSMVIVPVRGSGNHALMGIKVVHTLIWLSIESCVGYVLYSGFANRTDRYVAIAGTVVAGECVVLAANGLRCPLTDLAESYGAERGSVTDLYLPAWLARNLPAIHVPLLVLAIVLHNRSLRLRRATRALPGKAS